MGIACWAHANTVSTSTVHCWEITQNTIKYYEIRSSIMRHYETWWNIRFAIPTPKARRNKMGERMLSPILFAPCVAEENTEYDDYVIRLNMMKYYGT